ncbi:MAG: hypothetical protein R3272_12935 [Candidatus Promineifilaceae bacterium]|nr:hypothetical protein [Candidatus Promineifilaceae bacterium]
MGLDIENADRILPEHQKLQVGDLIPFDATGFGVSVALLEPERLLVLHGDTRTAPGGGSGPPVKPVTFFAVSWGFYLEEADGGRSRLFERWKADWSPTPVNALCYGLFLEPGAYIMERKMLLGLEERAERVASV